MKTVNNIKSEFQCPDIKVRVWMRGLRFFFTTIFIFGLLLTACVDDDPGQDELLQTNNKPVADAGPDQNVANGALVSLDGSKSSDPDGDEINFQWRIIESPRGSATQLSGQETATPDFIADVDGLYRIELVVVEEAEVDTQDTNTTGGIPAVAQGESSDPDEVVILVGPPGAFEGSGNKLILDRAHYARSTVSMEISGAVELTAEGWFFMTSLPDPPAEAFLMGKAGVFEIVVGSDSRVRGRLYPPSSGAPFTLTSTGAITLQTWHHIALLVDRTNNRAYIALDGKISNVVPPPTALAQNTNRFTVGSTDGTNLWVGMADEIRVTQDVRYPATDFTPPLELLVPDSPFISGARNTVHALYHFDEAAGAFQFRDFSLRLNTLFRIGLSGFQPFGRMRIPRQFHTATENAFNDGRIWIAGGIDSAGNAVIESEMIGVNGEVAFDGDLSVPMIIQVIKKKVGEGDGATTIFTFSLTPGVLQPGSVKVTAGSVVATDDGVGNMSGTGIASGTVDYTTGDVRLTYAAGSIPASGVPVTADYNFQRNSGILNHTATRLSDGRIVVAGGEDDQREPRGELFLITPTISPPGVSIVTPLSFSLNTPRRFHTATALADDSVQIALGEGLTNTLSSIEVLEPAPSLPDTFSLGTPRSHVASKLHKAVIPRSCDSTLPSEMLLLVGGYDGTNTPSKGSPPLRTGRVRHALACLPDGKILVTGGISKFGTVLDTVERYDPATDAYTLLSTGMNTPRADHTATLLDNGTVLIAGGFDQNGQAIQSAEIYDPAQNRFTILSSRMSQGRFGHIALPWTDLSTGNKGVLLIGGSDNDGRPIALLEIYFP